MKELIFQKELTLINQINQNNAWLVIIGILKVLVLNFNHMHVMHAMIYRWWFHDFKYKRCRS